jgi:hypothetical protein
MKVIGSTNRLRLAAAALAGAVAFAQPILAQAAPHGGGGGFHGGGFHGGGFGGFHPGGFHAGGSRAGGFDRHFGGGRYGYWRGGGGPWVWGGALGLLAAPYLYDDLGGYGSSQPAASTGYWYYCQNPAGYYPNVTQCSSAWQPVPAR